MNEELVERMERALEKATEDFEKQADRIVKSFEGGGDSEVVSILREIRNDISEFKLTQRV